MNATLNGHPRKSLSDQLDRFDTMLDGLADGLNDAVATAATVGMRDVVCLAVQQAVRSALTEILSRPEFQHRLAPSPVTPPGGMLTLLQEGWSRLVGFAKSAWNAVAARIVPTANAAVAIVRDAASDVRTKAGQACRKGAKVAQRTWMVASVLASLAKRYRFQLGAALAVGVVVGLVCWFGGREIASVGCGFGGFAGSLAGQTRRLTNRTHLAGART